MIAVCLIPFYILFHLYICRWLLRWLGTCNPLFAGGGVKAVIILVYFFFTLSIGIGFLMRPGVPERTMKLIGNYWMGFTLYTALTVILADVIRVILKHYRIYPEILFSPAAFIAVGTGCVIMIAAVCIYGMINARIIHTTPYEITVHKDGGSLGELNVVLIADIHLGYNIGVEHVQQMVEKVNANHPDLIVIAGDIFDNEYDALEDPKRLNEILKTMESTYGTYACYGNHDIDEKILAGFTFGNGDNEEKTSDPRMDQFLVDAGITLLQDEYVLIADSFYLYGRPDASKPGKGIGERKTPKELTANLDLSRPVLVMDHEPKELQELADAGVDVDLSGHTHDGQMFPMNLTCKLIWENSAGMIQKGDMYSIVTSGVGLFGPNMRVGTIAEICPVKITFQAD